jgi:hypothetical protein
MPSSIHDYIRDNRDRYTRDAIRQQLLAAGYDAAQIDAAWAMLDAPDPDATVGERFWGRFWLYLIGINLAALLIVGLLSGLLGAPAGGGVALLVILAIVLAIGALISWGLVAATQPTHLGSGTAIAIGAIIPLLFAFLIGGACYALIGASGAARPTLTGTIELHIEPPLAVDESGVATCYGAVGQSGFSVYTDLGRSGEPGISLSIEVHPDAPGRPLPNLYLTLLETPTDQQPSSYSSTPTSRLDVDASTDGLSGTLTFQDLAPEPLGGPEELPGQETISGSGTWSCE